MLLLLLVVCNCWGRRSTGVNWPRPKRLSGSANSTSRSGAHPRLVMSAQSRRPDVASCAVRPLALPSTRRPVCSPCRPTGNGAADRPDEMGEGRGASGARQTRGSGGRQRQGLAGGGGEHGPRSARSDARVRCLRLCAPFPVVAHSAVRPAVCSSAALSDQRDQRRTSLHFSSHHDHPPTRLPARRSPPPRVQISALRALRPQPSHTGTAPDASLSALSQCSSARPTS